LRDRGVPVTNNPSFLKQPHSRGRLSISEPDLKLITEKVQVFSRIWSILTAFTAEDGPYNEGRSGIYTESTQDANGHSSPSQQNIKIAPEESNSNITLVFETAYLLKHVELHGRPGGITPWSVRQFGFYQKFDSHTKRSSCIFIQTSLDIQRRLAEVKKERQMYRDVISHWTCLHLIGIGTLSKNWAAYIKFLDKKVAEIVSCPCLFLT
jgi:hypothetical protein